MTTEHDQHAPPLDLERLFEDAVGQALAHEDPQQFVAWCRMHIVQYLTVEPHQLPALPGDDQPLSQLGAVLGRAIWNAMPLPDNGLQPRPLPVPGRNDPCFCGSGRKYKHCCAHAPALPELDSAALAPLVVDRLPPARRRALLQSERLPAKVRIALAIAYQERGQPKKAAGFIEPLFRGEIRRHGDDYDDALTLLCNLYDELGHTNKKLKLLERITATVPRSPLRGGAWERLATIHMDAGDARGAWAAFRKAQTDAPDSSSIGLLEVQLLIAEDRITEAQQRAQFLVRRLRRGGMDEEDPMLAFLSDVARDPQQAMMAITLDSVDGAGAQLMEWLQRVSGRAVPAYQVSDRPPDATGGGGPEAAIAARLRGMGVAAEQLDQLVGSLQAQLEQAAAEAGPTAAEDDAGVFLQPPVEVVELERQWRELYPAAKPFSVNDEPYGDQDPWDEDVEQRWMAFLEHHPDAFDSLDILDDLATALYQHPCFGAKWLDEKLLRPLLDRSDAIVHRALDGYDAPRMSWSFTENRPPLRSLARRVDADQRAGRGAEAIRTAEYLVALNPTDNHGFRALLMDHRLREGADEKALALAEAYPGDMFPELAYGRVLALFRLGRQEQARQALVEALAELPKVSRYLTAARVRKPKLDPHSVRIGGDDQAWLYREAMVDVWRDSPGALDWLRKQVNRAANRRTSDS